MPHISSLVRIHRSAPATIRNPGATPTVRPSSRSQPRAREWNVPTDGASAAISSSILWRIFAARSVKVMTRIDAGVTPEATRRLKRSAITAVFPVPAPATTRTGPPVIAAARSWSAPSLTAGSRARCARGGCAPCGPAPAG